MAEANPMRDDYAVQITESRADDRTRVIKHGDSFAVFDHAGMIRAVSGSELGVYHEGMRFLSRLEVAIEQRYPLLLGSSVRRDGTLAVDLANPDLPDTGAGPLRKDTIHLFLSSFLWDGAWRLRLRIHSYNAARLGLEVSLLFGADYADIFEIRGVQRLRRGTQSPAVVDAASVVLGYTGLDRVVRRTHLAFAPAPTLLTAERASFQLQLEPRLDTHLELEARFAIDDTLSPIADFESTHARCAHAWHTRPRGASVQTSNARFDEWLDRSSSDLAMMSTRTPHGVYPYAGVPWFSTPFGRDGILTAFETLWCEPALARGVLGYLAATQATGHDPENDAEPGKIIHEVRGGEMAALGEIPFGRYYGSIDSTPLFLMLAGAYWRRTADRALIEAIWPNLERALGWIDAYGDLDADGFVEYARRSSRGLRSQGWKDSIDSTSHADGSLATGAIALCEVQGYVYAARRAAAEIAGVLGMATRAAELERLAAALRDQFERVFWCEDLGTYALALDGDKRPCRVRSSNPAHCLFTGIVAPDRAERVIAELMHERSFSGWGIRTLARGEHRFNPISYHNGSVWPHDNAIAAMGMARYGDKGACARVLAAMFEANVHFDLHRMPELFCGFPRRADEAPTLYPVACAPQAWAAAAIFMLLQACLGLEVDAVTSQIRLDRPLLPPGLGVVTIRGIEVGESRVDLALHENGSDVGVHLERRDGDVEVIVIK